MKRTKTVVAACGFALINACPATAVAAGFATRDLNPILQSVYLPARVLHKTEGWRLDHSLFVTNTLQEQARTGESLMLDVENYRYLFELSYRREAWVMQASLPLVANRSGQLDALIEDWHSFFGFPQGKRDEFPRDRIDIEYRRDGIVEYSQNASSNGVADIALVLGYQPAGALGYFVGLELPSGSESDFSGNEAVDVALWLSGEYRHSPEAVSFGMLGVSFPGDDGQLQGLIAERIWVAQLGFDYRFDNNWIATVQFDLHSQSIDDSSLKAFGNSLQIQLGLGFPQLIENHRLDLLFSEDILVGSAPDISFGIRLTREF